MNESTEIIDAVSVDGVVEPIRIADCELTARDLSVMIVSFDYLIKIATQESIAELVPIVDKLKKMSELAKSVP